MTPNEPIYLPPTGSAHLPLQAMEVAELHRRVGLWSAVLRIALELAALTALGLVALVWLAVRS